MAQGLQARVSARAWARTGACASPGLFRETAPALDSLNNRKVSTDSSADEKPSIVVVILTESWQTSVLINIFWSPKSECRPSTNEYTSWRFWSWLTNKLTKQQHVTLTYRYNTNMHVKQLITSRGITAWLSRSWSVASLADVISPAGRFTEMHDDATAIHVHSPALTRKRAC